MFYGENANYQGQHHINSETVIPNCSFDRHSDDPNTIDTAGAKWFHKGDLLLRSFHLLAENELKAYPRVL